MGNNQSGRHPPPSGRYHSGHVRDEGVWKGDKLWFRRRIVAEIVRDQKYPTMWRVKLPNGELSDMVNRIRAKDAAVYLSQGGSNAKLSRGEL